MGCDYYTWVETVILWKDVSGVQKRYVEKPDFENYERNYSLRCYGSYDPDLEEVPSLDDELYQKMKDYGKKYLYQNDKWNCTESGKNRILQICEEKKIPVEGVIEVYKIMNGYLR